MRSSLRRRTLALTGWRATAPARRSSRCRRAWALANLSRRCQCRKTALEIGDQIACVLKADVEADHGAARCEFSRGAIGLHVEQWDSEALKAAPGHADAEHRQRVEESQHRLFGHRLEHNREQSAGADEVALPDVVAGRAGQRRI